MGRFLWAMPLSQGGEGVKLLSRRRLPLLTMGLHPAGAGAVPSRAAFWLKPLAALLAIHKEWRFDQAVPHPVVLGCFAVERPLTIKFAVVAANGTATHVPTTVGAALHAMRDIAPRGPKYCVAGDGPRKIVSIPTFLVVFNNVRNNVATIIRLVLIGVNELNLITP